jgi:hypothetical protein
MRACHRTEPVVEAPDSLVTILSFAEPGEESTRRKVTLSDVCTLSDAYVAHTQPRCTSMGEDCVRVGGPQGPENGGVPPHPPGARVGGRRRSAPFHACRMRISHRAGRLRCPHRVRARLRLDHGAAAATCVSPFHKQCELWRAKWDEPGGAKRLPLGRPPRRKKGADDQFEAQRSMSRDPYRA